MDRESTNLSAQGVEVKWRIIALRTHAYYYYITAKLFFGFLLKILVFQPVDLNKAEVEINIGKNKSNILNYIFCHFKFFVCFAPLSHEFERNIILDFKMTCLITCLLLY